MARTRRYKLLIFAALLLLAFGLFLLTNLHADTPLPLLWVWMTVAGLGIGPSFAVFILVVQNAVPVRDLGSGTSSVTLFQQMGGTVGLAIVGSIFGSVFLDEVPERLSAAGVPPQFAGQLAAGGGDVLNQIGGVGDLGQAILAQVPEQFRATVVPLIPGIETAIHESFSIATASTFALGIVAALLSALVVLVALPAGRIGWAQDREEEDEPAVVPSDAVGSPAD